MSKRRAIGVLLLIVVITGGAVILALRRPSEPMWEGRKLSQWMERHIASSEANPPYGSPGWHLADKAIKEIGTNGIPTLLRMVAATENDLGQKLRRIARKQRFVRIPYRYSENLNREAEYAFELLGTNGAAAVPGLIKIYRANRSADSQMYAALSLGHIGPAARVAIPTLVEDFKHTNDHVRFYAVSAVGSISGKSVAAPEGAPAEIIPALRSMLKDSYRATRWNALVALTHFWRKAEVAIPDILEMHQREQNDKELLQQVELALWRIAPEKTPKALLVEENSPIWGKGVSTADLIMELEGERRTMTKSGAALPRVNQIWTNDPRGVVRLYRGSSDGREVFLGGYEVLGLPPKPEAVHAYILAVVAEGNIYACARDVKNEKLLDVKRVE